MPLIILKTCVKSARLHVYIVVWVSLILVVFHYMTNVSV